MYTSIITIGDEILIGQVTDTNSAFIAEKLTEAGIGVKKILSVSDKESDIADALDYALAQSDIVVITGGLGPTNDDITKKSLANYFNQRLIRNQDVLSDIEKLLGKRKIPVSELNRAQADVPEHCTVLPNKLGTAPGMLFITSDNKVVVSLPGVPFEMKEILTSQFLPFLKNKFTLPYRIQKTFLTYGVPESVMAERLTDFENQLPESFKLAYLPSPGVLRLRLSTSGNHKEQAQKEFIQQENQFIQVLGSDLYGYNDDTLEKELGKLLKANNFTVSTAESCTGGMISEKIAGIAGASVYFTGGIVAYSNDIKINHLNVKKEDIEKYGAVSKQVVIQMAEGIRNLFNTDVGIATSGIAGPTGGSAEKPVGTVWIALALPHMTLAKIFNFGEDRGRVVLRAANTALNMARIELFKIVEKTK